jgi:hypothetical protein
LINCDLENSFLLVYLSGPLIITHGPRAPPQLIPSQWVWRQVDGFLRILQFPQQIKLTATI